MAANQLARMGLNLSALTEQHPLVGCFDMFCHNYSILPLKRDWWEEEEVMALVVASLEVAVAEVVLDGRLMNPLKKILTKTLAMTMAETMTLTMTMIMVEGVVLGGLLMEIVATGLDHLARTIRGQTLVLMAPPQPGDSKIIPDNKEEMPQSVLPFC